MLKAKIAEIRICTLTFLLSISVITYSQSFTGRIIKVIDGDTFSFETKDGSFRVRSFGIDAPEGNQPFGNESAKYLSRFLNKDAVLKVNGTDRYKRKLGTLFINNENINLLMIKGGYA